MAEIKVLSISGYQPHFPADVYQLNNGKAEKRNGIKIFEKSLYLKVANPKSLGITEDTFVQFPRIMKNTPSFWSSDCLDDFRAPRIFQKLPVVERDSFNYQKNFYEDPFVSTIEIEAELLKSIHPKKKLIHYSDGQWKHEAKELIDISKAIIPIIVNYQYLWEDQKFYKVPTLVFLLPKSFQLFDDGKFGTFDSHSFYQAHYAYLYYTFINYYPTLYKRSFSGLFKEGIKSVNKETYEPPIETSKERIIAALTTLSETEERYERIEIEKRIGTLKSNLNGLSKEKTEKINERIKAAEADLLQKLAEQTTIRNINIQETLTMLEKLDMHISDIYLINNKLISLDLFTTKPTVARVNYDFNKEKSPKFCCGPFKISVEEYNLRLAPLNENTFVWQNGRNFCIHPHNGLKGILKDFKPCCLGELAPLLQEAFMKQSILLIAYYVHTYLRTGNAHRDDWGQYFKYFPQALNENHT